MTRTSAPLDRLVLPDGPFLRADLADQGVSRGAFYRLVAQGVVRCVVREVYVDAALPDTLLLRAAAVARILSPGHVAVDRTAAAVHGVDTLAFGELDAVPPIETCVTPDRSPTQRADVRGRVRELATTDIVEVGGLRVTTPLRTALDLGCALRRREALAAMCGLARVAGFDAADVAREVSRFAGRRGVIQLRELVGLVDPRIESPREAWVWLEIRDAGLPMPEPQVWVDVAGVPTYRLDFAYRRARVCVEYNGADFHDRTPEQRRADAERRQWLEDHGWIVIVVRLGDFTSGNAMRWLEEIRAALRTTYTSRRW